MEQLTLDIEGKPASQEIFSLLRGIDTSLRELREEFYDYRRDNNARMSRLEEEVSGLKREVVDLKISAGVTEHRLNEFRDDIKELRQEVSGLHQEVNGLQQEVNGLRGDLRELAGNLGAMQTRFSWWLVIVGIVIAAMQYWKG